MTRRPLSDFWVASCTEDGGIYEYRLYDDMTLDELMKIPADRPMYIAEDTDKLYALLRAPFPNSNESGFAVFNKNGVQLRDTVSTHGTVACHIDFYKSSIYAANYSSGSIVKIGEKTVHHSGKGSNPTRQSEPHPHSVSLSRDGSYVFCCDLGLDKLIVYDSELNYVTEAKLPSGSGPRHSVLSPDEDYIYVANETGGSVSVLSFSEKRLELLDTVPILPRGFVGEGAAAAIKLSRDGKRLYVSERASKTIATLAVNGDRLTLLACTDCGGDEPRDFTLLAGDSFAVCTNQRSNELTLFKIDSDGIPHRTGKFSVTAPLCAVERESYK